LCNAVLHAADSEGAVYLHGKPQPATAPQRAANAAMRFRAFLAHHARRIANEALPYIRSGALLLTHSHSGTVFAALARAHGAGKRFGVVCTESRPQFDGVQMARRLAAIGIEVEVIADAAAATFVNGFYTVLVGADAVTREGAVNKIGTLGLAFAAKQVGVPFYCFAGTEKFLPPGAPFEIAERDPAEIVRSSPNLHGFNLYFDQTPLDLISKLFTEDGPLTPDQVRARLAAQTLHAALVPEGTA
jgi:translation initiation factor 2B subunit (eIF-2B alpha/beta/delta family)